MAHILKEEKTSKEVGKIKRNENYRNVWCANLNCLWLSVGGVAQKIRLLIISAFNLKKAVGCVTYSSWYYVLRQKRINYGALPIRRSTEESYFHLIPGYNLMNMNLH